MIYKGIPWLLRIVCAITLGLVCVSRSFLGVHFLCDVFMGDGSGLIIIVLTSFLLKWMDRHPNLDWIVVVCGLILCVGIALYAAFKSYPVDYDAEGNILVDGAKMAANTFKGCGLGAGILVGWLLERRTVGFSTDIEASERITRAIVGIFFYYVLTLILLPPMVFILPDSFGIVATNFVAMLYIMWLFPWAISKYEERTGAKTPARAAGHFKTASGLRSLQLFASAHLWGTMHKTRTVPHCLVSAHCHYPHPSVTLIQPQSL